MIDLSRDIWFAQTQNSAVSEHANETRHQPLWKEVKFIDTEKHWYARKVKEAIRIRLNPNNINRDNGAEIPKAWIPPIRKHQSQRCATNKRTFEENVENENNSRIEISQSQQTSTPLLYQTSRPHCLKKTRLEKAVETSQAISKWLVVRQKKKQLIY